MAPTSQVIEWTGGDCAPADWDGKLVVFRDGSQSHDSDADYVWSHDGGSDDIVGYGLRPLRVDWNKFDLAEAYDLVEGVRRQSAQHPESGIDSSLRSALDAIEAADCEWDGLTKAA